MADGAPARTLPVCRWCGRPALEEVWAHYVAGHLQCECGRNISECCDGESNDARTAEPPSE